MVELIEHVCAVLAPVVGAFSLYVMARRARQERRACTACGCALRGLHRQQFAGHWYCLNCYSTILRGW